MITRNLFFVALIVSFACGSTLAHADEPIKRLASATPNAGIFKNATRNKPLVLRSNADAAMHFDKQELVQLRQSVDFKKQIVLVFAWKGSGQDRLTFDVLESFPEQVRFNYQAGRTRDRRAHVYVFALRSNVVWRSPDGAVGGEAAGAVNHNSSRSNKGTTTDTGGDTDIGDADVRECEHCGASCTERCRCKPTGMDLIFGHTDDRLLAMESDADGAFLAFETCYGMRSVTLTSMGKDLNLTLVIAKGWRAESRGR